MSASLVTQQQNQQNLDDVRPTKERKRNGSKKDRSRSNSNAQNGAQTNGQSKNCTPNKKMTSAQQPKAVTVHEWDYDERGECGPQHWLQICGCEHLGDRQSPIDLQLSKMRILSLNSAPLCLVNYNKPLAGRYENTGCGVMFIPDAQTEPPEIYGGLLEQNYRFIQYHFHWAQNDNEGSEHTTGGLRYPAELHLVHQGVKDTSRLAVLGIFLKFDDESEENGKEKSKFVFDEAEMDALRNVTEFGQQSALGGKHCLGAKLPANCCQKMASCAEHFVSSFVRYDGSLTTPPCSENVTWTVFTDPLSVTREQMSLLRSIKDCRGNIITKNYRPVQKCADREVFLMAASKL